MKKILIGYLIDGKNSGIDNYILNIIDQIKNCLLYTSPSPRDS